MSAVLGGRDWGHLLLLTFIAPVSGSLVMLNVAAELRVRDGQSYGEYTE